MMLGGSALGGAVRASLVADRAAVVPGEVFTVAVVLEIEPGWHTYWRNPGDSGAAPQISLTLPDGWEWWGMSSVEWPHPKRYESPGNIVDYVYEGRVALMAPVRVGERAAPGVAGEISAEVEWLECDADKCVPGSASLRLMVEVGSEGREGDGAGIIEAQRLKTPRTLESGEFTAGWEEEWLVLRVAGAEVREIRYFPYSEGGEGFLMPMEEGERDWRAKGGEIRVRYEPGEVRVGGKALGNLVVDRASGEREVWEVRARTGGTEN